MAYSDLRRSESWLPEHRRGDAKRSPSMYDHRLTRFSSLGSRRRWRGHEREGPEWKDAIRCHLY